MCIKYNINIQRDTDKNIDNNSKKKGADNF